MTTITLSRLRMDDTLQRINNFFFRKASARPLAIFRIGLSSVLLWQAFLMQKSFLHFFAKTGLVQQEVSSTLSDPLAPGLYWLIDILSTVGLDEHLALTSIGSLYVISLIFLLCGLYTRPAAIIAWFLQWSLQNTGYSGSYGADMYAHIFLFYLIWLPSGNDYSLDRLWRRVPSDPSLLARFGLRVFQLHMCISYLASGIEKATGEQWWNGEVLWRALNTPGYSVGDFHWMAQFPFIPMMGGIIVMAIEIFYCVMVWPKATRMPWVIATCLLHLGIAIFLRLEVFGLLMCIPTVALFAFSAEPKDEGRASVAARNLL